VLTPAQPIQLLYDALAGARRLFFVYGRGHELVVF
jgi:hypothetical protein